MKNQKNILILSMVTMLLASNLSYAGTIKQASNNKDATRTEEPSVTVRSTGGGDPCFDGTFSILGSYNGQLNLNGIAGLRDQVDACWNQDAWMYGASPWGTQ